MKRLLSTAAASVALLCTGHAAATDIGAVNTFLGIKIGTPISESIAACADLDAGDKSTICYESTGKTSHSIKQRPFLGFRYVATAHTDDSGAVSEIYLETLVENAPFLERLLTVRYDSEPATLVEYIYSKSAKNVSRKIESKVWLGRYIAVLLSSPDPFSAKDASVIVGHRSAFDKATEDYDKRIEEIASQL